MAGFLLAGLSTHLGLDKSGCRTRFVTEIGAFCALSLGSEIFHCLAASPKPGEFEHCSRGGSGDDVP